MKTYSSSQIKNVALLGSGGSGLTTLVEAMLFEGGVISRRGDIENKNTVSDYHRIEQEYGYSVFPTVIFTEFMDKKLNIIDCPGSDDFINGAITAMNVTDTAVMVVNASQGVEVGTLSMFRYTEEYHKPVIFLINQMDHEKANYEHSVDMIREAFGQKAVIVQYPVNIGSGFNSLVDVLKMKQYTWGPNGGVPEVTEISAAEREKADELHNKLVEAAAENDESLMELFFETGKLDEEQLRTGMRKGMINRDLYPIFCMSAKKSMGVRRFMEFLGNIVPHPCQMAAPKTITDEEIKCNEEGPTSLFVFKTSIEPHLGEVSYFKVMSGKVTEGMDLINTTKDAKERITQLFCMAGNTRHKVTELLTGDIGATVKLKETHTNHTLCGKGANHIFQSIKYPEHKFRTAVRPVNEHDDERLGEALQRIRQEDPTVAVEYSKELKQIILYGQGEFHLNTVKWMIETMDKVPIEFYTPRIPYRETITKSARSDYRHKKQSGGAGQFGEVHLIIEPFVEGEADKNIFKFGGQEFKLSLRDKEEHTLPWGGKLIYYNCIVGGAIDARFMPAILKGIMEKMEEGPLTGSYARDIKVYVYDGKMHPVDSNEISFKLAGRHAFSQAFREAGPKVLEPIYDVEVKVPGDRMGDVMSDLQGRRAMIEGMTSEKGFEVIRTKVPLKEMNKYSTSLSSITGGRAMYSMKFAKYEKVPSEIQEKLLAEYSEAEKD